jgi:hypothetical protein
MTDAPAPTASLVEVRQNKSFEEGWAFGSDLKKELKATSYVIDRRLDGATFSSGREKWEARFYSGKGAILACRDAMELVSKRTGKPYHVVKRE